MELTVGTAAKELALSRKAGKATGTASLGHTTTHHCVNGMKARHAPLGERTESCRPVMGGCSTVNLQLGPQLRQ